MLNRKRDHNPYYQGPVSDHFDGLRFFNPEGVPPGRLSDVLKWQFTGQRSRWPSKVALERGPARPEPRIDGEVLRVTMVGHATMLIQSAGLNILTDPVWSARTSPVSFAGPKRVVEPGIAFDDLPKIDIVLVSHNHYDHLDLATLKQLCERHHPLIITPLGNDTIIRKAVPSARFVVMDWGDSHRVSPDLTVDCQPAHHWSARGQSDRRMALWAAFVLHLPGGRVYHIGDTGFHQGINYKAAGERYGSFRLAILPIGAYEPRWFMQGQHQNPDEAVKGMLLSGSHYAVGHHFGCVQLTDEAIDAPVIALEQALDDHRVDRSRFIALKPGFVFDVPPVA